MKICSLILPGVTLLCGLALNVACACTTFVLGEKNNQVFCRNYDWDVEDALVIVNRRGMAKSGYPNPDEKGTPAR